MQRASQPEIIGVAVLGVALLVLATSLRAAQPGIPDIPAYAPPLAAATVYLLVSLVLAGASSTAGILFAAMLAAHIVYGAVMGCAFVVMSKAASASVIDVLNEGLSGYPPAALLQAAFVSPLVGVTLWPRLSPPPANAHEQCEALRDAQSADEFVSGVLAAEAIRDADPELMLSAIARKARELIGSGKTEEDVPAEPATLGGPDQGDQESADRMPSTEADVQLSQEAADPATSGGDIVGEAIVQATGPAPAALGPAAPSEDASNVENQ